MRRSARSGVWVWSMWAVVVALWILPVAAGMVTPRYVLTRLALGFAVIFGLIVTHELGHALVGKVLGYRIFELSIGAGPSIVDVVVGRTRVVLGPLPAGGHTLLAPTGPRLVPAREVFVSLAGPAVNLYTLAWALGTDLPAELRGVIVLMSAVLVVGNLVPRRATGPLGVVMSDGLRGAQALDIDDVGVRRLLASRYGGECYVSHRKGDDAGALAWAERGLVAYPDEVSLEGALATSMIMVGEYREARDRLHRLLDDGDLDPALRSLYQNNLAWADLMTADPHLLPEALATSQAAFEILPMQPAVRGTRGFALILSGAIDEGIALCEDAFRAHRDERSRASNACAMSIGASRQGRIGTAERFLTTAIRLSPENDLIDRAAEELRAASAAMTRSAPEPRVDA